MLRFCGFDLELLVEEVLAGEDGLRGWSARDMSGEHWLIVQVDDHPLHLAWLCAPLTERALQAVLEGRGAPADALRHSSTGTAELVTVDHGRAVRDRCLLGAEVAEELSAGPNCPVPEAA